METNKWQSFVLINELPDNGVFLCTITDDVLDAEDWPIWAVVLKDGHIVNHIDIIGGVYRAEQMLTWTRRQLAEWVQYEPSIARHPQEFHSIMRIA